MSIDGLRKPQYPAPRARHDAEAAEFHRIRTEGMPISVGGSAVPGGTAVGVADRHHPTPIRGHGRSGEENRTGLLTARAAPKAYTWPMVELSLLSSIADEQHPG
jgi:hypothetical protein